MSYDYENGASFDLRNRPGGILRPSPDAAIMHARRILANAGVKATITIIPTPPKWMPGDVVVVRHDGQGSQPYTYVRGVKGWPGERISKTDAQMDALYVEGKAKPVLQSGGVPFAASRLK